METTCTPTGCQCACHRPGMDVSHVVPCCFAAGMLVETRTEWRCEICSATFDDEQTAWDHWLKCRAANRT